MKYHEEADNDFCGNEKVACNSSSVQVYLEFNEVTKTTEASLGPSA
jgi:hypothetical protein